MSTILHEEQETVNEKIHQYLKSNGISITHLAKGINVGVQHLHKCLVYGRKITDKNLKLINEFLKTNF